jgi:hypothetical protein
VVSASPRKKDGEHFAGKNPGLVVETMVEVWQQFTFFIIIKDLLVTITHDHYKFRSTPSPMWPWQTSTTSSIDLIAGHF